MAARLVPFPFSISLHKRNHPFLTPNAMHQMVYRPEVDGLRALAVIPVILFHAGFTWFSGGFVGVDVFFVISGYLITTIILTEKTDDRFTILGFYERRARRILPALFFVMLFCFPFAWSWMTPEELEGFSGSMIAVALFASNILFWKTSGYFDSAAEEKPLLHTWSLGVEEQYYLLFPLFIILTWGFRRRAQVWLILVVALMSLAISEWAWRNHAMANFYLAPTRAWELLIGSLLAFAMFDEPLYRRVTARSAQFLSALGMALVLAAVFLFDKTTPFPSLYALVPTAGAALILGFASGDTLAARLLSLRWVVGLGLISYSAYLWHQPLLAFARLRSPERPSTFLVLALCIAAICLAYLSWRFVERPVRDRRRIGRGPVFALSAAGSLLFIGAGIAGTQNEGFPARLNDSARALLKTAIPSPKRDACHTMGTDFLDPDNACVYLKDNATWAVLGDSHTLEPAYALAEMLASVEQGLVHLSFSGCPPALLFESTEPGCTRWLNRALTRIENDGKIRNVLVGFRYSSHLFGDQLPVFPAIPDRPFRIDGYGPEESRDMLWRSFEAILVRLQKSGKRVFVLAPIPELGRPIQQNILAGQFKADESSGLGTSRAYYDARNRYALDRFRSLPWGKTLIAVDPAAALCDEHNCRAIIDGTAMYFDDDHLSLSGAHRVLIPLQAYLERAP